MKTHRGLRSVFARLAQDEPGLDPAFTSFLANAYDLKSLSAYADNPASRVATEDADAAIETAERFISAIATLIGS